MSRLNQNNINELTLKMNSLKSKFDELKEVKNDIHIIFEILHIKIMKLKNIYQDFLRENKNNLSVFGLDSFKFQNKLIDTEYNNMWDFYTLITNRMYCDYYKLYTIIGEFVVHKVDNEKIKVLGVDYDKKYAKYNYLNIYKHYEFSITISIFDDIMNLIVNLIDYLNTLGLQLDSYDTKKRNGLNIHNFVYTFAYKKSLLEEQIQLYINYLDFFLRLHTKYLLQFTEKIRVMYNQTNKDIQFEDTTITQRKRIIRNLDSDSERASTNKSVSSSDSVEFDETAYNESIEHVQENEIITQETEPLDTTEVTDASNERATENDADGDVDGDVDDNIESDAENDAENECESVQDATKEETNTSNRTNVIGNVIITKADDE